jgi:hypothetical protein
VRHPKAASRRIGLAARARRRPRPVGPRNSCGAGSGARKSRRSATRSRRSGARAPRARI